MELGGGADGHAMQMNGFRNSLPHHWSHIPEARARRERRGAALPEEALGTRRGGPYPFLERGTGIWMAQVIRKSGKTRMKWFPPMAVMYGTKCTNRRVCVTTHPRHLPIITLSLPLVPSTSTDGTSPLGEARYQICHDAPSLQERRCRHVQYAFRQ